MPADTERSKFAETDTDTDISTKMSAKTDTENDNFLSLVGTHLKMFTSLQIFKSDSLPFLSVPSLSFGCLKTTRSIIVREKTSSWIANRKHLIPFCEMWQYLKKEFIFMYFRNNFFVFVFNILPLSFAIWMSWETKIL